MMGHHSMLMLIRIQSMNSEEKFYPEISMLLR